MLRNGRSSARISFVVVEQHDGVLDDVLQLRTLPGRRWARSLATRRVAGSGTGVHAPILAPVMHQERVRQQLDIRTRSRSDGT